MGLIQLEPTLHRGERILWQRSAALSLSDRVVAGVLYVTSEAVLFMPNRFNRRSDLVSTRLAREQIAGIDMVDPVRSLGSRRNGAMRRRLRVRAEHQEHLFVIKRPEQVAAELIAAAREWPEPA